MSRFWSRSSSWFALVALTFASLACAHAKEPRLPGEAKRNAALSGAQEKVIAFYGDSTIRGYKTHSGAQVRISTPEAFAQGLGPNSPFAVRNEGVDSSRIEHLMAGTDGRHAAWATYLPTSGVDIVITNHASKNGNTVEQYESDLRDMVRVARSFKRFIILMTPSPIVEGGLESYVTAMRRVAEQEQVPLIDVYRYLAEVMAESGRTIDHIVPDGYHPADDVYVLIGRYAARRFRDIALEHRLAGARAWLAMR